MIALDSIPAACLPVTALSIRRRLRRRRSEVESLVIRRLVERAVAWRWSDRSRSPAAPVPPPASPALVPSPIVDFELHLAGLTGDDAAVLSGELHHIGLEEVRDALGDGWPALAPQLGSFAATRLQLWTGLHDEVRRRDDSGFVVRFANLPPPAAERQAKRLALRLKAELVEEYPQLADARLVASPADGPAHEVMARRLEASRQFCSAMQTHDGSDPRLWRSALGQAAMELLEADSEVSADSLIAHLQSHDTDDLVLRTASIDAAIERLRAVAARGSANRATGAAETAPGSAGNAA